MICLTRSSRNCQMSPLFERMIPRCISLFFNPFLSFPPPYLERSPPSPAQKEEMGEGPKTQNPFSLSSLLAIKWEVDGGRTAATLENRHRFLQVLNVVAKIRPIVAPDYRKAPTSTYTTFKTLVRTVHKPFRSCTDRREFPPDKNL